MGHAEETGAVIPIPRGTTVDRSWLWLAAALTVIVSYLYSDILFLLVKNWWNDPNFSHGFFVPIFAAFFIWQKRGAVAAMPLEPAWSGLAIILLALLVLVVGVVGAELFLSRTSLILLLAGLVVYFLGWNHFRTLIFPWAFLFLMVPLPDLILSQVTLPLQFLASDLASGLLTLVGVPVLKDGNILQLPTMTLEVAEACSGIRSLVSLVTLAVIYGYFSEKSITMRVILVLGAVPIAVAANSLRVMGTGLLGLYWAPDKAEGFFHTFSGWVIFILSLGMLFLLHGALRSVEKLYPARRR